MRTAIAVGLVALLLAGCEQKLNSTRGDSRALPSVSVAPLLPPTAPPARPVVRKPRPAPVGWAPPAFADTVVVLGGRHYALRVEASTDSTKHLTATYEAAAGHPERVHGFEGRYTFTLRDSLERVVFRRQLRKSDFFTRAGADIVTESEAFVPSLLGYSAPLGALVFTLDFMVPESDVGAQIVLLLDLSGRVLRLSDGRGPGTGPECDPALSPDGYSLLTASEIVRAQQPPLRLTRSDADLVGASFLGKGAVLVVYAPGKSHLIQSADGFETYGRTPTAAQLRAPNAFVRHPRSGRVLSQFRYHGFYEELGYVIPGHTLRATSTHYLLDEKRGLYLLSLKAPVPPTEVRFSAMPAFKRPQKAAEVRFEIHSERNGFAFYVDTTRHVPHIRYQRIDN